MTEYVLRSARYLSHDVLERIVQKGDTVIDATAGNGHDTCFLAELAGENGHVIAFDVQTQALEETERKLKNLGYEDRAELILAGHEHMSEFVKTKVRAVVFNLGWLPGSDKTVRTRWETTRQAVDTALSLLLPHGICTICVYPGHPEGFQEAAELPLFLAKLLPQEYNVLRQTFLNAGNDPPECYIIQKQI